MKSCRASTVGAITAEAPRVAEVTLDADVPAEGRPAADLHGEVEDVERSGAGDGLGLQHPQRRVGAPAHERDDGVADERAGRVGPVLHGGHVLADHGLLGEGLAEVLQPGRGHVADGLGDAGVHHPEAARGVEDLEHGEHDAESQVDPGAVVTEAGRGRHAHTGRPHRAGRVAAQAEPVERRRHLEARRIRRHEPQRGAFGAIARPARPHVGVGLAGRRHPALAGVEDDVVAVGGRRPEGRPELAARAGLRESQGCQVAAGGDRRRARRPVRTARSRRSR